MLKIYDIRIAIFIDFIEPSVYKGFQSKADLAQLVELLICNHLYFLKIFIKYLTNSISCTIYSLHKPLLFYPGECRVSGIKTI